MPLLVFVTCSSADEAKRIARHLLEKRLVACANIVPRVESHYWWKGKLVEDNEALLILKTMARLSEEVRGEIEKLHSYEAPVIEFLSTEMNKKAMQWLDSETKKSN